MHSRLLLCSSLLVASVAGHGLIRKPQSRNQRCGVEVKPDQKAGTDCEAAFENDSNGGYQFMSVLTHALGRDVVRPLPTNVCGFDSETWNGGKTPWDEPIDWPTTSMTAGTNEFVWDIQWGPHFDDTMDFKYWMTKEDYQWELGKMLTWDDFEDVAFCSIENFDYANPGDVIMDIGGATFTHNCDVPARSGRHIIYGEWGRNPNTYERFHGCSDVVFDGPPIPTTPTPPGTTPAPATPSPPTPTPTEPTCTGSIITVWNACTNSVECCEAGTVCEGNQWYRQCRPAESTPSTPTPPAPPATPTPPAPATPTPPAPATPTPPAPATPTPPAPSTPMPVPPTPLPQVPTPSPSTQTCNLYQACTNTPDCCPSGSLCYRNNEWYSQCLQACPSGWECNEVQPTPSPPATPPAATPTPPATNPTPTPTPPSTPTPVVSPPGGNSGNLVSLDFESESLNTIPAGWETFTDYSPNLASATNYMYVDSTRAYSGSKSFKVMGPANGPAQIVQRLTTDPQNVYFRAYYWLSDTMGNQAGDNHEQIMGTKKYESATRPFSADAEIRVGQAKGHLGFNQVPTDAVSPPFSQWYSGPQIPKEQWVCVEAAVLTDVAFDELHMWVNDELVNSATSSADWHSPMTSNWAEGLVANVYFGWHSFSQRGMDMWIDDIEVSTERIGC